MSGLAVAERIGARLHADLGPGDMKNPVEPEGRLVAEHHNAAVIRGRFLMAGRRSRSQCSRACTSARARALCGRCHREAELLQRPREVMIVVAHA
jgi:hypothetical protein